MNKLHERKHQVEYQLINRLIQILNKSDLNEKDILDQIRVMLKEHEVRIENFKETTTLMGLFEDAITHLKNIKESEEIIHTGFTNLDKELGGIFPGELIIIGGRPGMGKSQLMIQLMLKMSPVHPVLYYSFDLPSFIVMARTLSILTNIPVNRILRQELTHDEIELLNSQKNFLEEYNLFINDTGHNALSLIKTQIGEHVKNHSVKIVVVDYLQLMSTWKNKYNRDQEISFICRELKNLAKELGVCVFLISQLSRSVESRGGSKKPLLSDLRDSGSIEQDADKVIFIYRPEYYQILEDENGISTEGIMELIIAKNRNGKLGSTKLLIDKEFTLFTEYNENYSDLRINPDRLGDFEDPF